LLLLLLLNVELASGQNSAQLANDVERCSTMKLTEMGFILAPLKSGRVLGQRLMNFGATLAWSGLS